MDSEEYVSANSSLCILDEQTIQTDAIRCYIANYFSQTSLRSGGPLEFDIKGNSDEYIDVNDINLHLKFTITKSDGTDIETAKDKVGLNNLPMSSLFSDILLTLGENQIEGGQQVYPYTAYLHNIMQFHPAAQSSHMLMQGWVKDEAGKFDDETNSGFVARQAWTKDSQVCELYGPLYLDFFKQSRYLISKIDMKIKLVPSKTDFSLNAFAATKDFKIRYDTAVLYVKRIKLNPAVMNGHARGLRKKNALYPINHTEMITFTIPRGQKSYVKERLFPIQQPKMLMIAMVTNDAFNGNLEKNPFHFQHFDLDQIILYREGENIPGHPLRPDFAGGKYARSYVHTMSAFNYPNTDDTNGLTYDEFGKGYTIYAYDLTATGDVSASYRDPYTSNNLRLDLSFAKALPETINVLVYAIFDSQIEITQLRDVITNYTR